MTNNAKKISGLRQARQRHGHEIDSEIQAILGQNAKLASPLIYRLSSEIKGVGPVVGAELVFSLWQALELEDGWENLESTD